MNPLIYEKDLDEAIAVCQGERNPNANTCLKLAAYYTLKHELFGKPEHSLDDVSYSFAPAPVETVSQIIDYKSDTDFSQAINGRKADDIWPIIDEMMTTVQVMLPRLYDVVMRKLRV